MSNPRCIVRAATAIALACSLNTAYAVSIVDTGEPFSPGIGNALLGSGDGRTHQFLASMFTVTNTYVVGSVSTHLYFSAPNWNSAGTFNFKLYDNNAGLPGSVLYASSLLNVPAAAGGAWYSAQSLNWLIAPGSYWLSLEAEQSSISVIASAAGTSLPNFALDGGSDAPGQWESLQSASPSLRIDAVAAVPEPSTFALMALGAVVLGIRVSKQRYQAS